MTWHVVQAAFKGLSIGVIILLFMAVLKLKKAVPHNFLSAVIFVLTLAGMLSLSLLRITIPSVSLIFIGAGLVVGLVITLLSKKGDKQ